MASPIRRIRARLGAIIQRRADAAVSEHVRNIQATLHGLAQQVEAVAVGVAEWQLRVSETFTEVADRLEEIDHRSKESLQLRQSLQDLAQRVEKIGLAPAGLAQLRESVIDVQQKLSERLNLVEHEFRTLKSQVRAQPFSSGTLPEIVLDGDFHTWGYTSEEAGPRLFVDIFRPNEKDLIEELSVYSQWLPSEGEAVDLGAGRGEMVEVMTERGLTARGVDLDPHVVEHAVSQGRMVTVSSIDDALREINDRALDVITLIHVVEHVDTDQLCSWLEDAARVLRPDGRLIIETPNPHAVDAFKAFWLDTTHVRPYYPEALLHLVHSAGFTEAFVWARGDAADVADRLNTAGAYALIARR